MGEVHAAPFQDVAFLDEAGDAAATLGPLPCVAAEGLAVHLFQALHDEFLEFQEEFLDAAGIHACSREIGRDSNRPAS